MVVDSSCTKLVKVREPSLKVFDPSLPTFCRYDAQGVCQTGDRCRFAHSEEERMYWKWETAKMLYAKLVSPTG